MSHDHTFCNMLLQCFNKDTNAAQPNLAAYLERITKKDIYRILELIHLSHDSQMQIKLIFVLTLYMMTNGTDREVIIKFNPIYDKICEILTKGHQKKSNVTLNFLASLLHTDDEGACTRGRALIMYAQNMIRASGCLMAMANLFINGLLHQDTWQTLCLCLADSCSGLESNQNYCSHLIPVCVRRCRPGNEHVFQVVQSLLSNSERNTQLFYKSGGCRMFNREYLKYDRCLQLLNTVVANPSVRDEILKETDIVGHLQDLKQLYGATSQVGQWVSIIFYTLNLKGQVSDYVKKAEMTKHVFNKEVTNARVVGDNVLHVPIVDNLNSDHMEETSELLKNIMTEVLIFKQGQNIKPNIINTPQSYHSKIRDRDTNKCIDNKDSIGIKKIGNNTEQNMSLFSFLLNNNSVKSSTNLNNYKDDENNSDENFSFNKKIQKKRQSLEKTKTINKNVSHCCNKNDRKANTEKSILDFKPKCASTPKQTRRDRSSNFTPRPIHKTYKRQNKNFSIDSKLKVNTKSNKEETVQRGFGANRIFDAINETCTTIMRSVTNVFRSKKRVDSASQCENTNNETQTQCGNSFTKYMMQRDAMSEQDSTNSNWNDLMEDVQYECNTCNDTLSLRRKFVNDDFLKETVNKLKLGINLYGCNFKKISKMFWRNENYMTTTVLYNLYRKLILK